MNKVFNEQQVVGAPTQWRGLENLFHLFTPSLMPLMLACTSVDCRLSQLPYLFML